MDGKAKPTHLALLCCGLAALLTGCADLVVTSLHHDAWLTHTMQVKATVKNEGGRDASASSTRIDIKPHNAPLRTVNMATPALARNQEHHIQYVPLAPGEVPAAGSGQCLQLIACADASDAVTENLFGWLGGGESNNCRTNNFCR
jgi:hypothetical protein